MYVCGEPVVCMCMFECVRVFLLCVYVCSEEKMS